MNYIAQLGHIYLHFYLQSPHTGNLKYDNCNMCGLGKQYAIA